MYGREKEIENFPKNTGGTVFPVTRDSYRYRNIDRDRKRYCVYERGKEKDIEKSFTVNSGGTTDNK